MKALVLTQPWATLVAIGAKQFETRSWDTQYRGTLAICAGKGIPAELGGERGHRERIETEPFKTALRPERSPCPRGGVIAVVELVETFRCEGDPPPGAPWQEEHFGNFSAGRFMWELRHPRPIALVPVRGHQKIFNLPPDVTQNVLAAIA